MADSMNQMQLKYARQRAETILQEKIKELTRKHTIAGETFTDKQRLDALREGRFTILDKVTRTKKNSNYRYNDPWAYTYAQEETYYGNWCDYIVFTDEKKASVDHEAIETERKALRAAFDSLMDELMLGDYAEALKLLKQFEAL